MKVIRAGVILLAVGLWALAAQAQDWRGKGRVDGWVKDPNGQPIAEAVVELKREKGGGTSTKSNKKGYWVIVGLIGGPWNMDVSAPGYQTRKIKFSLNEAGRVPPMDIQLEPQAAASPAAPAPGAEGGKPEVVAAVGEGNRLIAEKKFAEARAEYEKALAAVPGNVALLRGIAQTYEGEGNKEKTIEVRTQIQSLAPTDSENGVILASLLVEKGKLEEGKAILDKLAPGAVTEPGVYVNLGILFMNKKNLDEARSYLTKAIELDPANADAYYFRGLAHVQAKKNTEAKADLKKYLELKPEGPEAKEVKEILAALK